MRIFVMMLVAMMFVGCASTPKKDSVKVEDHCDIARNQMPLIEKVAAKQLQAGVSINADVKFCSEVIHGDKAYVVYSIEMFMLDDEVPFVRTDFIVFFRMMNRKWVPVQEVPFSNSVDPKLAPEIDENTSL